VKTKLEKYAFSKQEIKILKEVASGNYILSRIRESSSIKPSLLSYYLKKLQEKDILKIQQHASSFGKNYANSRKSMLFRDTKHSLLLKELLTKYSHIKWENVLSGLGVEVLFQILTGSESIKESVSPATFWRYSRNLMALGIVTDDGENLQINDRFSLLTNFLEEYQTFIIRTIISSVSDGAVVLWQKDFECLIRVPKTNPISQKGFTKTATSCLSDFGIQLISDFDIYFYSKRKTGICLEDIILHTLLIERENVRYVTYSLLLLKKELKQIDKDYLLKKAVWYDLSLQINAMLEFLRTRGTRTGSGLPTWNELRAKLREYEVKAVN
jgi:DNA-binding MarR family transcriptional regulator